MASIKNLKKDINYTLGDIIGFVSDKVDTKGDNKEVEAIIDETITTFDALIAKINKKGVENKKAHYNSISADLEARATELVAKINKL
jgi:HD superfamily phosphohydrolase YqeK